MIYKLNDDVHLMLTTHQLTTLLLFYYNGSHIHTDGTMNIEFFILHLYSDSKEYLAMLPHSEYFFFVINIFV